MKTPARRFRTSSLFAGLAASFALVGPIATTGARAAENTMMDFGNFSVSLAVRDIRASKAFYERLDFKVVGGKLEQNWLVLQNGSTKIGLFQGMFERNLLTFNPGWTKDRDAMTDFQDVRELQRTLKARGIAIATEADETTRGPAFFKVLDPDGNTLLFDQHVASPMTRVPAAR